MPATMSVICSRHFREDDIDRTSLCGVRIRENAVPSIFTEFPKYLQNVEKARNPAQYRLSQSQVAVVNSMSNVSIRTEQIGQCRSSSVQQFSTQSEHCTDNR